MFRWTPYTFVRTVIFFIGGILLSVYFPHLLSQTFAVAAIFIFVAAYMVIAIVNRRVGQSVFNPGVIALPIIFLMGYIHLLYRTDSRNSNHPLHVIPEADFYQVVISGFPQEKEKSWKTEGQVMALRSGTWKKSEGNIVLYFDKKDFGAPFRYGDVLLIRGRPDSIQGPLNPGEFDYKRFLSFRNIYHQDFLRASDVNFIRNDPPSHVLGWAIRTRLWADETLKKFVSGKREQAIASALVLGVTDGLDNELLSAYAATGAMHVLAVSGLHISIIYLILVWLLKPLNKTPAGKWILALISLLVLWSYAFVTGLSPSVLRAVTMFSFVAIARPWSQNTNIFNTLAASAFCLLVYDPYLIMSVGFQLSYLAVLGIVYLQPKLYALYEADAWLTDEIWKITCVSIAAQVATFSLGLLYFHQFPNYFLLSNLLVIPISFGVLILGLLVLAFNFISFLAIACGFLLELSIKLLNLVVFTVESFPFSLVEDIHISTTQCWLLMGVIIATLLMIQFRQIKYFYVGSLLLVLFTTLQWLHYKHDVSPGKITVYRVPGHSVIDLIADGKVYTMMDSALLHDKEKLRFHIKPNRLISGIRSVMSVSGPIGQDVAGGRLICWHDKTIVYVTDEHFKIPSSVSPDLMIIGSNAIRNMPVIPASVKTIVLDSSNSYYYSTKFSRQARQSGRTVHAVLLDGAFNIKI
jgi:competence protein ComEC